VSVLASASTSAFDQPGTLGFLVVAGMAIILVFLFRSMNRHLRKVSGVSKRSRRGAAGPPAPADPQDAAQALASAPEQTDPQHE
jgi:hypothetical protein